MSAYYDEYYHPTKLLSLKDINKKTPEIYICDGNRTGGKTTAFNKILTNRFLKNGTKFGLIYRFKYELDNVAGKFFKDIKDLYFNNHDMTDKIMSKGVYSELFIDKKPCGYAMALSDDTNIKKLSHFFNDIDVMLFDEFQPSDGRYLKNEVQRLVSIHTSIARGKGKQVRYVPVYMVSNSFSLLNPYYMSLGLSSRIQHNTKFLRGDGWVYEHEVNERASELQKMSAFNRALADDSIMSHNADGVYLNDNYTFVSNMHGKSQYIATIIRDNKFYSIKKYNGVFYCDTSYDLSYPTLLAVTMSDMIEGSVYAKSKTLLMLGLKKYFTAGLFRFKNLDCKNVVFDLFNY